MASTSGIFKITAELLPLKWVNRVFKGSAVEEDQSSHGISLQLVAPANLDELMSSLKTETQSGRVAPYDFNCTFVRLNTKSSSEDLKFLFDVAQIVSRYGGYAHEFKSDTATFYFKDEDHTNSRAVALASVCDVNRVAHARELQTSLAWGSLHFQGSENAASLSGSPLSETATILSLPNQKGVVFSDEFQKKLNLSCRFEECGEIHPISANSPQKLVRYIEHTKLKQILESGMNVTARENLSLYRNDDDIADLLRYIKKEWRTLPSDRTVQLIGNFKKYKVPVASPTITEAYIEVMNDVQSEILTQKRDFVLASFISISVYLFRKEDLQGELKAALLSCLLNPNRRVVANAVEIFAVLDPSCKDEMFDQLLKHADNRILANLLAKEGKDHWDRTLAKRVKTMIDSKDPLYRASGLYALGEIAQYMQSHDVATYHSDSKLQDLLGKSTSLLRDKNLMVARQAKLVQQKLQPAQVTKPVRKAA